MNLIGHEKHFFEYIRKQAFFNKKYINFQRRRSVLKRGGEGWGLIVHSAIRIPLIKFFKIPFALFVSTSILHGV